MNRRTFLRTTTGSAAFLISHRLCFSAESADAEPTLEEISAGIEGHRKGLLEFYVKDANGKPVPNVPISIEQVRHEFLFGCNFFMFGRVGNSDLEDQYRNRFADLLNYATLGFYWRNYEAQRGSPTYEYTDRVLEWTKTKGIICKGHPLVWDHPAGSPRWLPENHDEIRNLSNDRVREIVKRFAGRLDMWDVVNEAVHLPDKANKTTMAEWALAEGPSHYVAQHLKIAREANPAARLLVNDYRIDPPYVRLLEKLQGDKAPFDIVGIQSHMHGGPWPARKVKETCDTYAKLGLPIHFTETTVVSGPRKGPGENWGETNPELEDRQAQATARFYTALFAHPAVEAITWWDFSDRGAWQGAAAGWLRKDMSPKPVYDRLKALIKGEWWTRASGKTDAQGRWATRAFFGRYTQTIDKGNGLSTSTEMNFFKKGPHSFVMKI